MDIDTDDDVLQGLALGKGMDYAQWPALFPRLMSRLEQIVYNEFPIPKGPSQPSKKHVSPIPDAGESSTQSTQSANKENDEPVSEPAADTIVLPKQLQNVYKSITSTLTSLFTKYPPHTIQRFAELILSPKEHYRTLPSYLHALDRVVHVTSGAHTFPLPPAVPDPSSLKVLSNGTSGKGIDPLSISWGNPSSIPAASNLGSDESLGGALLTPITWLSKPSTGTHSPMEGEVKTESTTMTDGPNGPGGVETVTVSVNGISSTSAPPDKELDLAATLRAEGGVTQGELLRQEQRAGVVPATQLHGRGDSDGLGEEDELPHARGPEEIGMEDMGPQSAGSSERKGPGQGMQGIDIEAAVGRKIDSVKPDDVDSDSEMKEEDAAEKAPSTPKREADEEIGNEEKRAKPEAEESKNAATAMDVDIVDVDGKTVDEPKVGEAGETKGPDAGDTSSV